MAKIRRLNGKGKTIMQIQALGDFYVEAGWFPSAVYEDGTPVAGVAAVQEFRDGGSRSFMRTTVAAKRPEWANQVGKLATRVTSGKLSEQGMGDLIGAMVVGDVQRTISKITEPELAESTKAARRRRGNSSIKPLLDQRIMFNTMTYNTLKKGK